jgi:Rrf2 family protein
LGAEIAASNQIPKKFLDHILMEFRVAGIVRSRKGSTGGYSLFRPASEIRIGDAIRVIDGPLAPIRCASRTAYEKCDDCADPATCLVRKAMTEVRDAMSAILDELTLEQMIGNARFENGADDVLDQVEANPFDREIEELAPR